MVTDLKASRLMIRDGAKKLDENHPEKSVAAAMAKQFGTEKCFNIIDNSLQMFGGYGYL